MYRNLTCFCNSCLKLDYDQCSNKGYVDKWTETTIGHKVVGTKSTKKTNAKDKNHQGRNEEETSKVSVVPMVDSILFNIKIILCNTKCFDSFFSILF